MDYIFNPSLDHLAAVKVATMLWNPYDITDVMSKLSIEINNIKKLKEDWLKIEDKIKQKASQLFIPEVSKEKILGFIKPVGLEILKWMEFNYRSNLHVGLPQEFCWTSHGTLDRKRTAEFLVKNESIDIVMRYRISCCYCLDNSVRELWTKMPENCKNTANGNRKNLLGLWTCIMKGQLFRKKKRPKKRSHIEAVLKRKLNYMCSAYQYAFEYAADNGNIVAVDYFYHKMTPSERSVSLVPTATFVAYNRMAFDKPSNFLQEDYSHILFFLLSKMNYEEQIELLEKGPGLVLKCLLDWPWQIFFMETANICWNFITPGAYTLVAMAFLCKMVDGHKYFNYRETFKKIWQQSSRDHRRSFFADNFIIISRVPVVCIKERVFVKLFRTRDENIIKLVLPSATLEEKKKRMYDDSTGQDICSDLIENQKFGLLDYFIRHCISSKNEMITYRTRFLSWLRLKYNKKEDMHIHQKCIKLLDGIIRDFDKGRKMEPSEVEENANRSKRICIIIQTHTP